MKVAIIGTATSSILGFRSGLIKELLRRGHVVYAFALDYTDDGRGEVRRLGAIPVDYEFNRSGLNPFLDFKGTIQLATLLKKIQPDLVFSYFAKPVIFATLAAAIARVPRRVGMLEGLGFPFTDQPRKPSFKTRLIKKIQVFLYRIAFRFLERVIFLNKDDVADLVEAYNIGVKHVSVLGGIGLDLSDFPYVEPPVNPLRFIFVGRLLTEKGVYEYIEAAREIKETHPAVEFVLLGGLDKDNPGSLTEYELERLKNKGVVLHPGHVSDVGKWLANSSVFVLPSYREGVPLSTQEAMATGRPIITTDVPGCRETVIEGENGFLVPPWSSGTLVEKMRLFINDPALVRSMGEASRQIAQNRFDGRVVNNALVRMLESPNFVWPSPRDNSNI